MSLWLKDIPVSVEARLDLTFYSHKKMERTCFVKKMILTNELVRYPSEYALGILALKKDLPAPGSHPEI